MQQATYYKQKNSQMVPFLTAGHIIMYMYQRREAQHVLWAPGAGIH